MSEIQLFPFQAASAEEIAKRYEQLSTDDRRPMQHRNWETPFYQALSALTGAGKTAILADAVAQIRALMTSEPIVLWISKGKAVVDQTYANLQPGGKYEHLVEGFLIEYLSSLTPDIIRDGNAPCIVLATVGTFNQKDREDGTLRVYKTGDDKADIPLWTLLKERKTSQSTRRPLIIVYDEGHNLSDQQTTLLLDLEPNVILVASATMKTPQALGRIIDRLKEYGWTNDQLVTSVQNKKVVEAQLVKKQIVLGGYATSMELALDEMLDAFQVATDKATDLNAGFLPKAIYVSKTNISQDDGSTDLISRPFEQRKAPPILIWRYLVEEKGIDPSEVAVYCDLKFDRRAFPPPDEFILFSGGEDDFAVFSAGNYRHIIFNQSLQEGWDDPACCFAYIDKSMGSPIQVEQVIGRVLRQPNATHYPDLDLNTANFFIRVDNKQIFPQILDTVRLRIAADIPDVRVDSYTTSGTRNRLKKDPKVETSIPEIHIDADAAVQPLINEVSLIMDYRNDMSGNTIGKGNLEKAVQLIGEETSAIITQEERPHSNPVRARWILRRGIQLLFPEVVKTIDWSTGKFDALVEINSPAAVALREKAEKLVDVYLENCELTFEEENQYTFGQVLVNPDKCRSFSNAVHEGYSDLNELETRFAIAIDATGYRWVRNPSNGGYSIPLLEKGSSRKFFPDFLVWRDDLIYAIDPKGGHLVNNDAGKKLLDIKDENGNTKIHVRLISEGQWESEDSQKSQDGYCVWMIRSGRPRPRNCHTIEEAIRVSLGIATAN